MKSKIAMKLLDAIDSLGLSHDESVVISKELIKRYSLKSHECFPDEEKERQEAYTKLRECLVNGAEILLALITPKSTSSVHQEEKLPEGKPQEVASSDLPRKGYTKNGKRIGRPPKKASNEAVKETPSAATKEEPSSSPDKKPENVLSEKKDGLSPSTKEDNDGCSRQIEVPPQAEETSENAKEEAIRAEAEKLKMGREYTLDALYSFKGVFIRTNRILTEGTPIGVFIPRINKQTREEFILYYKDENGILTLNQVKSYARCKLPKYEGHSWEIKDTRIDSSIGAVLEELNAMLKKMGGDPYKGYYYNPLVTFAENNTKPERKYLQYHFVHRNQWLPFC